jgi:hypothetical protein
VLYFYFELKKFVFLFPSPIEKHYTKKITLCFRKQFCSLNKGSAYNKSNERSDLMKKIQWVSCDKITIVFGILKRFVLMKKSNFIKKTTNFYPLAIHLLLSIHLFRFPFAVLKLVHV